MIMILVGGMPTYPSKKMANRQLGWWHSQLNGKSNNPWLQTTNQKHESGDFVLTFRWRPKCMTKYAWRCLRFLWQNMQSKDNVKTPPLPEKVRWEAHTLNRMCMPFFWQFMTRRPKSLWPSRLLGCHMSHGQLLLLRLLSVGNVVQVNHGSYNLLMQARRSSSKKGSTPNVPVVNHMCQDPVLFKRSCTENTPTSCWTRDNFWQFVTCWPWKQGPSRLLGAIMCHLMLWFTLGLNVWDLENLHGYYS